MKAALYNSHLRTLGGGEQHALAIARWLLERGHDVDLLARPGVTIDECEARLGVSLKGARVVELDDDPIAAEKEATARSASYELFVNATYWGLGLEDKITANAQVDCVGEFHPTFFGAGKFKPGVRPSDLELK